MSRMWETRKKLDEFMGKTLNPDALYALYTCCQNAVGVYEFVQMSSLAKFLPGLASCKKDLEEAIALAEQMKDLG